MYFERFLLAAILTLSRLLASCRENKSGSAEKDS